MDHGLQARRDPTYFGIPRPELIEEDLLLEDKFLSAGESEHKDHKPLFGFLHAEGKRSKPDAPTDPTALSRANKFGGN